MHFMENIYFISEYYLNDGKLFFLVDEQLSEDAVYLTIREDWLKGSKHAVKKVLLTNVDGFYMIDLSELIEESSTIIFSLATATRGFSFVKAKEKIPNDQIAIVDNVSLIRVTKDHAMALVLSDKEIKLSGDVLEGEIRDNSIVLEGISQERLLSFYIKKANGFFVSVETQVNSEGKRILSLSAISKIKFDGMVELVVVENILDQYIWSKLRLVDLGKREVSSMTVADNINLICERFASYFVGFDKLYSLITLLETDKELYIENIHQDEKEYVSLRDVEAIEETTSQPDYFKAFPIYQDIEGIKEPLQYQIAYAPQLQNHEFLIGNKRIRFAENQVHVVIQNIHDVSLKYFDAEKIRFQLPQGATPFLLSNDYQEINPFQMVGEDEFQLSFMEESLDDNQTYLFGYYPNDSHLKQFIRFDAKRLKTVKGGIVDFLSKSYLTTKPLSVFIEENYTTNRSLKLKVNQLSYEDQSLILQFDEKISDIELFFKLRNHPQRTVADYQLFNRELSPEIIDDYSVKIDLSALNLLNEKYQTNFWDLYGREYDGDIRYIKIVEVSPELIKKRGKEIAVLEASEVNAQEYRTGLYFTKNHGISIIQAELEAYLPRVKQVVNKAIHITEITMEDNLLKLKLADETNLLTGLLEVTVRSTKEKFILAGIGRDSWLEFSLDKIKEQFGDLSVRFDFKMSYESTGSFAEAQKIYVKKSKRKEGLSVLPLSVDKSLMMYTTSSNLLCAVISTPLSVTREYYQVNTELTELKRVSKSKYQFAFTIASKVSQLEVKRVYLKLRSNEYDKEMLCDFKSSAKGRVTSTFNMNWDEHFPLYWDLLCDIEINGEIATVKIKGSTKEIQNQVAEDYLQLSLIEEDKHFIVYPYITFSNDIAFMIRNKEAYETEQMMRRQKRAYATYKLFKKYFDKKQIWLSFEKFASTAQDNGYAFFDYVQENRLNDNHYYVLSEDSADYPEVKAKHKNVLKHMSFKYFVYLYASKLLIASETPRHVYNIRIRSGEAAESIMQKKSVFLQHGVTALKKSNVFKKSKGRGNFDLVVATSQQEKEIIHENWLYDNDQIITTGFARWDLLKDKSVDRERKEIFVMPTWRSWMEDMPESEFINTDYYRNYVSFLQSSDLHELLERYNLELSFFLHPKFKEYIGVFGDFGERIHLYAFGEIKVNEKIMASSMMISDYSSVTWDMFYMGKPVTFFQFDSDKYNEYEGSYIDMDTELFGDRVFTVAELIENIELQAKNKFVMDDKYQLMRKEYFKYLDHDNCKRIYEEIRKGV